MTNEIDDELKILKRREDQLYKDITSVSNELSLLKSERDTIEFIIESIVEAIKKKDED